MQGSRLMSMLMVSASIVSFACAYNPRPQEQRVSGQSQAESEDVVTLVSDTLRIDTTYHSMEGPSHHIRFTIGPADQSEVVWITGMSADVVAPDLTPLPVEFFCHANLDYDPVVHRELFKTARMTSVRLFTLSQGHEVMRFPDGFGIPVRTNEPLFLMTQVLSNNGIDAPRDVRVGNGPCALSS
jgi:hypothetical protein